MSRRYSFFGLRKLLHNVYAQYQRDKEKIPEPVRVKIEEDMRALEKAILEKNREEAERRAKSLDSIRRIYCKKSLLQYAGEIVFALVFAFLIAVVVRQMWFEFYEIPTGSMRPSFREKDRLAVSKTAFGLNMPLRTDHFYFDPNRVERGKVVIFSGDGIPELDQTTKFLGLLPYTKRYIKRLIGKPGDTLYFYGGKIYGVDKGGKAIDELLEDLWMIRLEHIPFITFEGETTKAAMRDQFTFSHMGKEVGRLRLSPFGEQTGEIFAGGEWKKEAPFEEDGSEGIASFGDLWGMGNFAMARLLNKEELSSYTHFDPEEFGDAELYLQLKHNPNLTYPRAKVAWLWSGPKALVPAFESVIPLTREHLERIMDGMYTARFVVKNGVARRYGSEHLGQGVPFRGVEDGTYEFYNGKAFQVGSFGLKELAADHPLSDRGSEQVKKLFNFGMEMYSAEVSGEQLEIHYPQRYAYFRDGDLYVLGVPLLDEGEPVLQNFVANEIAKEKGSTSRRPYKAFVDRGAPVQNGELNKERIKAFGITVPEGKYFVLGDNHAMSADSRIFGFVPEKNIQGAPSVLFWPPGERWGHPPQSAYPFFTLSRGIVWAVIAFSVLGWFLFQRRRLSRRLFP